MELEVSSDVVMTEKCWYYQKNNKTKCEHKQGKFMKKLDNMHIRII